MGLKSGREVGQELGGDLEGNPPKSESHAKDRKLAKTGCPTHLLSRKRASCLSPAWGGGSGNGAGGNLGKTRTKASQAVGSEGPRELSGDSESGVLECCGVISISLGIDPFIQKYLVDAQRHKKTFGVSANVLHKNIREGMSSRCLHQ